jgi:hypothetical protein
MITRTFVPLLVAALLNVSCSSLLPRHTLQIENRDGPTVQVMVGNSDAGILRCGEEMGVGRGEDLFGPLPWSISFLRNDGSVFATTLETEADFHRYIVIRRDGIVVSNQVISGPMSEGCGPT